MFRPIRPRISSLDFAASARSMIATAREHVEPLAEHGVTPALVDEAEALLHRYAATTEESAEAVSDRVKAVAELKEVAAGVMDVIARMDGLNQHRLADDPELLAAWKSAKDVVGPVTRRNGRQADVSTGDTTPPSTTGGDVEATA